MSQRFFLKPNLVIEPLFMRWYAWSYLISPGTSAMNIVKRHMEIMNSYVDSPQQHIEAVKDPKMLGGPFMDYGHDRSEEVKTLLAETLDKQSKMVQLAFAFRKLDKLLKSHTKGYALEELYDKVPPILRGYVELVYDLNNNLSFRVFEELLYHTEFYDKNFQSIALWITNNDSRPFSLSTPKLDEPNVLHLPIAFDDSIIDELARMKRVPGSPEELAARLNMNEEEKAFSVGYVALLNSNSNGSAAPNPGAKTFRVVIISASNRLANPNVNWKNYDEVKKVLNLQD